MTNLLADSLLIQKTLQESASASAETPSLSAYPDPYGQSGKLPHLTKIRFIKTFSKLCCQLLRKIF